MNTVTREQFAQQYGAQALSQFQPLAPKPAQAPLLERAGAFVSKHNLPGSKIGENIGTQFAALKHGVQTGDFGTAQQISQTGPTEKQLVGDVARSAALAVSPMVPNPASISGAIGLGAGLGAVSGAGDAAAEGGNVAKGALLGAGIGAAGGFFSKMIEKGVSLVGRATGATGEKITQTIIKPSKADFEDGFSLDTVKKYNLGGSLKTMQAKTDQVMDDLTKQLNAKYTNSPTRINVNEILNKTIQESAGSKTATFGSNTSMENAFNQLKGEIAAISADGTVSVPDAVQIKRAAGHFGAWVYGQTDPESTARQKVYTAFYRQLKEAIEQGSEPGVKELNKELSDLIPVMNAIIRRIPVAERNATLSLTDIISLSASSIEPASLSVFAANQLSKSGVVGKALMDAGPAIEKGAGALTPAIRAASTALPQALGSAPDTAQQSRQQSTSQKPSMTDVRVNDDGSITTKGPFSGKDMTIDATGALGVSGGAKQLISSITKKAKPSDFARIGEFLRKFDTDDLPQQMSLMDNYASFFEKLGVDHLSPDDLLKVLNKVMLADK
jgi:hypothetical protein